MLQQKTLTNFWAQANQEPLPWLLPNCCPSYPPAMQSASLSLLLAFLPSPGTRLPPSAQVCFLPHSLTILFSAPSGHPVPGPSFHLEGLLRDAYRLDGHREIYSIEKPKRARSFQMVPAAENRGWTMTFWIGTTTLVTSLRIL